MILRISLFLFLSLLSYSTFEMHLNQHIMTTNEDLQQLQHLIELKVQAIKTQMDSIYGQIHSESDIDKKIELAQNLIISQRNNIIGILQAASFDLNQSQWTCQQLGPIKKNALYKNEQQMKSLISALASDISQDLTGHPGYSIISVIDSANTYLASEVSPFFSKGTVLPDNQIKNRMTTNYHAGFWALGTTTVQSFKESLRAVGNTFVQFCPFFKPFLSKNGTCVQCPSSRPYWLLSAQTCIKCPTYHQNERQCLDAKGNVIKNGDYFTNIEAGKTKIVLFEGQSLDQFNKNYEDLPLCPADKPFFNDVQCIDCPSLFFSLSGKNCRTCPTGSYHDSTSLSCKQQFYYSRAASHSWTTTKKPVEDILEAISIKKSNVSYTQCPQDKPFSKDTECIACEKKTHFSYDTLQCESCPSGTILNLNMHKCHVPGNLNFQTNPINTSNLIYNGQSQQQWLNKYYRKQTSNSAVSDCPEAQPNFDGTACIKCPNSSPYFNLQTLICQQCEGTTLYSSEKRECLSHDSNRPVQTPTWEKMAAAVLA